MSRRLPPLNSLRAFEAAARHLSFTRAADELAVTQAAISHQIRTLEDYLGKPLFLRLPRSVELTPEGRAFLPGVTRAFDSLYAATSLLLDNEVAGRLTVSVIPSFAARWLVPRLGRFRRRHPDIDLLISPSRDLADFTRGEVDVGIRYSRASSAPGLHYDLLMTDEMVPVARPDLDTPERPLKKPEDLVHHTLLHDEVLSEWDLWLQQNGVTGIDTSHGPMFVDSSLLIQAAIDGLGVALARVSLVELEIAAGRLVNPFPQSVKSITDRAYYFVCPEGFIDKPRIAAFRGWLLDETRNASK